MILKQTKRIIVIFVDVKMKYRHFKQRTFLKPCCVSRLYSESTTWFFYFNISTV